MPGTDRLAAVIVAGGSGQRFGKDKLFLPLGGRPLLAWSILAFDAAPSVAEIVVVLSEANLRSGQRLVDRLQVQKPIRVLLGGPRRQDSAGNGLRAVRRATYVAIHDGARPFVTTELIEQGYAVARQVGGAVAGVPVTDTIKVVGSQNLIEHTPNRARLWAAQTPQIFRYDLLIAAQLQNGEADVTDDAELFERAGHRVALYPGSSENVKLTRPEDLPFIRSIARRRQASGRERSCP
jgi:2-C-methyl-D-erythritol 4-phosphate cytidylyltransferase